MRVFIWSNTQFKEEEMSRKLDNLFGNKYLETVCHLGVFSMFEDTKYTICNTCQMKVSRGGGSMNSYTTTNLVSHLVKHSDVNKQYIE